MMKKLDYFYNLKEAHTLRHKIARWLSDWHKTIVFISVFYIAFTTFLFEGYQIPSGSMEPTLIGDPHIFVGDRIFAAKAIHNLWPLQRGDIVIFISAEDHETFIVKRLVAFPGEEVQIKNNKIYINDKKIEDSVLFPNKDRRIYNRIIESYTDKQAIQQSINENRLFLKILKGEKVNLPDDELLKLKESLEERRKRMTVDVESPLSKEKFIEILEKIEKSWKSEQMRPKKGWACGEKLKVPQDCYFVLGDNTNNSNDSRYWGWLPKEKLLGRAILIWWPPTHSRLLNFSQK